MSLDVNKQGGCDLSECCFQPSTWSWVSSLWSDLTFHLFNLEWAVCPLSVLSDICWMSYSDGVSTGKLIALWHFGPICSLFTLICLFFCFVFFGKIQPRRLKPGSWSQEMISLAQQKWGNCGQVSTQSSKKKKESKLPEPHRDDTSHPF